MSEARIIGAICATLGVFGAFYSADAARTELRFVVWVVVGLLLAAISALCAFAGNGGAK